MARIHILRDIVDLGLDPKVAHTGVKSKGRLRATVNNAQETAQEVVQETAQEVLKEKTVQEAQVSEQKKQQKQKVEKPIAQAAVKVKTQESVPEQTSGTDEKATDSDEKTDVNL